MYDVIKGIQVVGGSSDVQTSWLAFKLSIRLILSTTRENYKWTNDLNHLNGCIFPPHFLACFVAVFF